MNKVHLVGRLGREPELRYTEKGTAMCFMTIAVDDGFDKVKKEKRTAWIPVMVWAKLAENCANGLIKGSMVSVTGRISPSSYEKDGAKVYKTDIVGEEVEFLVRPKQQ